MKRLLVAFCMLCACVITLFAQEPDGRRSMVDTIAVRLLKSSMLSGAVDSRLRGVDADSSRDRLAAEYALFRVVSDQMYEHYKNFSTEELRRLVDMTCTRFYRVYTSMEYWQTLVENVMKAVRLELGQGSGFSYRIRDEKWRTFLSDYQLEFKKLVDEAGNKLEKALLDDPAYRQNSQVRIAMDNVIQLMPVLIVKTMMEYLSYEECVAYFTEYGGIMEKDHALELSEEPSEDDMAERIRKILDGVNLESELISYAELSRGEPYFRVERYRPVLEMKIKKGTYSGQTYDGLPHGTGTLTDKKGVQYAGDFKDGLPHGRIMVSRPGCDPELQVWYKGKLRKDIAAEPLKVGDVDFLPPAMLDGRYFGYGFVFDSNTKTSAMGFYIDGLLDHFCSVITPSVTMTGTYRNGQLINGSIKWQSPDWKYKYFSGECYGDVRKGVLRYCSNDETYRKVSEGLFVGEELNGHGRVTIETEKSDRTMEGLFVDGDLWGEAKYEVVVKTHKNGMSEKYVYEGTVAMGRAHGEGRVVFMFEGVPDKPGSVRRYGVKLPLSGSDKTQVDMHGYFEKGRLVKGTVLWSDGSFMQGTFADGVLNEGRMLRRYSDGSLYEGECRGGKYHGYGSLTYADGTVYEGLFENGYSVEKTPEYALDPEEQRKLREALRKNLGQGKNDEKVFLFENLPVEKGVARIVRAAGVKIMVRGVSSVEVTCKGIFDGQTLVEGKVTVSDGNWMEGRFEDGVQISGRARTLDKYGTIYTGDIKNGYPHGNGKCVYKNGTWFEGKFANGNRMDGTHYSADGRVIRVYR